MSIFAYKLFRVRADGSLGSLFIDKRKRIDIGQWYTAESHPTKGYAEREGYHATVNPYAPHLSTRGRVWCLVELIGVELHRRPQRQGGGWYTARAMRVVRPMGIAAVENVLREYRHD